MSGPEGGPAMTPLFEVVRDSSTYGVTRVIGVLLGLASMPVLAHVLKPDELGMYSLAFLTITVAYQFFGEWSRSSILRFDSRHRGTDGYSSYLSNLFIAPHVLALIAITVFLVLGFTTSLFSGFREYLVAGAAVFLLSIMDSLLITLLRVRQKAAQFSILQLLNRLVALLVGIALILLAGLGGEGLIYGMLVSLALCVILGTRWTGVTGSLSLHLVSPGELRGYLSYGIPLTVYTLFAFLTKYIDRYVLSCFTDMDQVGIYSFASMLPQRTTETFIGIIALGAFPVIVREWERSGSRTATQVTSGLARLHLIITAPFVAVMVLFPDEIIGLVGSPEYMVAHLAVPILAAASYFTSIAWFSSMSFSLTTRTGLLLKLSTGSLILNFALNLLLVPLWGYQGAALSSLVTSIAYFLALFLVSRRWLPWGVPSRSLRNTTAGLAVGGLSAYLLQRLAPESSQFMTLAMLILFSTGYITVLLATREIDAGKVRALLPGKHGRTAMEDHRDNE